MTVLLYALTTLACEVDTHQLSHTFREDVRGLISNLLRKNIPMSLTLRLEESTAAEEQ